MIVPMSIDYAAQIAGWEYENKYSIYSFHQDDDTIEELMNGEYYAYLEQHNELSGYFCFGKSARIPTVENDAYALEILDVGLGMNPTLCGKGYGYSFVKSGLDFAQASFDIKQLRLTVAEFNTRAIRVYEKIGFQHSASVTHRIAKKKFIIMTYTY